MRAKRKLLGMTKSLFVAVVVTIAAINDNSSWIMITGVAGQDTFVTRPPTERPTAFPSLSPSDMPSPQASNEPSNIPSDVPTERPSWAPSFADSAFPSNAPSVLETSQVPSLFPSETPSAPPTICIAPPLDCARNVTGSFSTNIEVRFDDESVLLQSSLDFWVNLLTQIPLAYDRVAGSVCDSCRRRITDVSIVFPASVVDLVYGTTAARRLQQQQIVAEAPENFIILSANVEQSGNCTKAFDNNKDIFTLDETAEYQDQCNVFFDDASPPSCCCFCRDIDLPQRVSREEFRDELEQVAGTTVDNVVEVEFVPDICDPGHIFNTTERISVELDPTNATEVDLVLKKYIESYNELCQNNCIRRRIVNATLGTPVNGNVSNRRGRRLLQYFVNLRYRDPINPTFDDFYRALGFRRLQEVPREQLTTGDSSDLRRQAQKDQGREGESIFFQEKRFAERNLQVQGVNFTDGFDLDCLCNIPDENMTRTFEPPSIDEHYERFQEELDEIGLEIAPTPEPTLPPTPFPTESPTESPIVTSKGKGKGKGFTPRGRPKIPHGTKGGAFPAYKRRPARSRKMSPPMAKDRSPSTKSSMSSPSKSSMSSHFGFKMRPSRTSGNAKPQNKVVRVRPSRVQYLMAPPTYYSNSPPATPRANPRIKKNYRATTMGGVRISHIMRINHHGMG